MARVRYLEPWWLASNVIEYNANGIARVTFPPVPQRTWNVAVGMYAIGNPDRPGAIWKNLVTSIVFNENNHIIGNGCPLGLIATQGRATGREAGTAFVLPNGVFPTFHGFGWFPGDKLELYDGLRVCGAPYEAGSTVTVFLQNLGDVPADEIQEIGFLMVELPEDKAAENYQQIAKVWEDVKRGLGGVSFATHRVDSPAPGGVVNADSETVLSTWHNYRLRRTDLRGMFLRLAGVGVFAADENGYAATTINTRSDLSRDVGVGFAPAPAVTGYAGLRNSGQFPLDFKSDGSGRQIITVNAPNLGGGPEADRVYFCGIMQGIPERQYFGRVAGESF